MLTISRLASHAVIALTVCLIAGCGMNGKPPQPAPPATAPQSDALQTDHSVSPALAFSDPCATRLHDLSGALLLYYSLQGRLPDRLDDLRSLADSTNPIEFACPVSHQPYAYDPRGLSIPGKPGIIVVYDAEPSHGSLHWAISIIPATDKQPINTRIVALVTAELRQALISRDGRVRQ